MWSFQAKAEHGPGRPRRFQSYSSVLPSRNACNYLKINDRCHAYPSRKWRVHLPPCLHNHADGIGEFQIENRAEPAYAVDLSDSTDPIARSIFRIGVRHSQAVERTLMQPSHSFEVGKIRLGGNAPLFLIAGPCVIESEAHATSIATRLAEIAGSAGIPLIFKASYDKANRSSIGSFRGPGLEAGLRVLAKIKKRTGLPILTDVHEVRHVGPAAEVCDALQIPAFLSRQTDLLVAVGRSGRVANIKKGQFLSPWDVANAAEKIASTGNQKIILTERGVSFGYQNLVVDMRSFPIMRKLGYPVVFDVTHAVQLPGGEGNSSGGQPEFIEPLARAGAAAGIDGLFLEVHDNPAKALSDGTNALALENLRPLLEKVSRIAALTREWDANAGLPQKQDSSAKAAPRKPERRKWRAR
jgi:2-dehydro-3-deoxyphosphooctonate aldolase (KDO 8-P synthase)